MGPGRPLDFADSFYDLMPFPVLVTDPEAQTCALNSAARRALGRDDADRDEPLSDLMDEPDLPQLLGRLALSGRDHVHPLRFRRIDGSSFEATAHVFTVVCADGALGYAVMMRSLTSGGSHGEQIMLGSRIYSALDTVPEGLAIFDRDEKLVVFNRTYRDRNEPAKDAVRVGATLESILRANVRAGIHRGLVDGTPEAEAFVQSRMAHHRSHDGTPQLYTFGDRWIRAESHLTPSGEVVGIRIDVTDLKRIEQALDEKQRQYADLLQILPDLVVRTDGNMRIKYANDRFASFHGHSPEAVIGKNLWQLAQTEAQIAGVDKLRRYTPETPLRTLEISYTKADGEVCWLLWTAVARFEGDKAVEFVAVARDITQLKRQNELLAQQTLELQRKNRALNQFTATVSHDLKAPIRHIARFAEMIVDDVGAGQTDDLIEHSKYLNLSAQRMQKLVESLLDFAQIADEIRHFQTVSLNYVVADAIALLDDQIRESNAKIEVDQLPAVGGDPELLRRLMQNLIGNAIKYRCLGAEPHIRVYGDASLDQVRIVVEDNGIGIDPTNADMIFGLFRRLHSDESKYAGTGIGLALAKRIVDSHSGTIVLDTSYTGGARFIVALPRGDLL